MSGSLVLTRRAFMALVTPVAAMVTTGGALATAPLIATPRQTTGPFYPRVKPADSDADLVSVAGRPMPAKGTVTHVIGRVLDSHGRPVEQALIEIWQCDALGQYHHPRDGGGLDPNFQGYGRTETDAEGRYRFRTIRPVPYPGRTPHIHFAISAPDFPRLTTQMYVAGEPLNERDFVLNSIADPEARAQVIVPLKPATDLEPDSLLGTFDIRLGAG
jgi:protocatechuate 3,4-dioxygenase beta subunit